MSTYLSNIGAATVQELVIKDSTTDLDGVNVTPSSTLTYNKIYPVDASKMANKNYLVIHIGCVVRANCAYSGAESAIELQTNPAGAGYVSVTTQGEGDLGFNIGQNHATTITFLYTPTAYEFANGMSVKLISYMILGPGAGNATFMNKGILGYMVK